MTTPADPRSDQNARRLQDFYRLRELLRLHGRNGELHIPSLPQPERAEAAFWRRPLTAVPGRTRLRALTAGATAVSALRYAASQARPPA